MGFTKHIHMLIWSASEDKNIYKMNPATDINCGYSFRTYYYLRSDVSLNRGTLYPRCLDIFFFVWRDANEDSSLEHVCAVPQQTA